MERSWDVTAFRDRSFMVPLRSPRRITRRLGSAAMVSPSRSALRSRWLAVNPACSLSRTDGRWAT
ncbi:hypothetical protein LUX02_05300 [Streptomyces somaliensis]|nr:hypothetical protein [Streptomyces somaliensis]